jgi:hypothetical protein
MRREFEDPAIYKLTCDVHPWMRAFVVVTEPEPEENRDELKDLF